MTTTTMQIQEFITSSFLFGDVSRMPGHTDSLLETGVMDSTGVLELIEFLEMEFDITVEDDETVPDNLGSIDAIAHYVDLKSGKDQESQGVA